MELQDFEFLDLETVIGEEIVLLLERKVPGNIEIGFVPAYWFAINLTGSNQTIGTIDLRVGNTALTYYGGHIGYAIDKNFRGNRYALKACELIKGVALAHGMDELIITCNPDNIASNKTCTRLGAEFTEIVDIPDGTPMYLEGERQKCIYKWRISK